MKKFAVALAATALIGSATLVTKPAHAIAPPPFVAAATAWSTGAGVTTGFIGVVAAIATYDFVRRTTCIGDPLGFGGPGFTSAIKPTDNVLIPQCPTYRKKWRR